jgi:hypothetical protein
MQTYPFLNELNINTVLIRTDHDDNGADVDDAALILAQQGQQLLG